MTDPPDIPAPARHVALAVAALFALFGGLAVWTGATTVAGSIAVQGTIAVAGDRQIVQHRDGGVVAEIPVANGDTVAAGEIVLRLDAGEIEGEIGIVQNRLNEVRARRSMFEAELDGTGEIAFPAALARLAGNSPEIAALLADHRTLLGARLERRQRILDILDQRLARNADYAEGLRAREAALRTELALLDDELSGQGKLLEAGLAPANRVLAMRRDKARIAGEMAETVARIAQAKAESAALEGEREEFTASTREDLLARLREARAEESELAGRLSILNEKRERLDVRAPVAGVVFGLAVTTPGSVLRPGDAMLFVIPQDRPPVLVAEVPGRLIDQVRSGQTVRIRVPALSSRTLPDLQGKVETVDADATLDARTGRTFYRTEIAVTGAGALRPEEIGLRPGMSAEAIFLTAQRSPASMLLGPLADAFGRAFLAR